MKSIGYGARNEESTPLHPQTSGVAPTVAFIRRKPRDYRVGTLLASIFCFFPIGLIAVYFSYQVSRSYVRGDLSKSVTASQRTKFLLQTTIIIGCLVWFGSVVGILYSKA